MTELEYVTMVLNSNKFYYEIEYAERGYKCAKVILPLDKKRAMESVFLYTLILLGMLQISM